MIAVDTNILLRYVLRDDVRQTSLATGFVEKSLSISTPGFISLIVVCEFVWALVHTYRLPRDRIGAFLIRLAEAPQVFLEHREIVILAAYGTGDVADSIIHQIGQRNGCSHSVTFDRKFARLSGVELLA